VISAAGAAGDGTLLLRAPALIATDDVAISSLAANTAGVGSIVIEPVLPFNTGVNAANATPTSVAFSSATAPTATDFQNVYTAVSNYMGAAVPQITSRLAAPSGTPLLVEAGVEIVAPGALTLASSDGVSPALDLSSWQFDNAPVDLTVRAAGGITVLNNVQDGFATVQVGAAQQTVLLSQLSSSIRLVAGADLSSANPLAVVAAAPGLDLTIGSPTQSAVVRTGTGTIDLVAADDVIIRGAGSGAYTAGVPAIDAANLTLPKQLGVGTPYGIVVGNTELMSFPTGGGDLYVSAGQDILGVALAADSVPTWQLREGGATYGLAAAEIPPEWGVNLNAYNWNLGTLGGGDLKISAGGNITNVTAAAADSLLPNQGSNFQYVTSGTLSMQAGGDIGSAQIFVADGTGSVRAGGGLTAILPAANPADPNVGSFFYLESSAIDVTARTGIAVDGVFNPTALSQITASGNSPPNAESDSFFSYGASSALNLEALSGEVVLGAAASAQATVLGPALTGALSSSVGLDVFPASLGITAVNGNIDFGPGLGTGGSGAITLYPSARGELDLLAAQNIENAIVTMSDASPGSYPTVATPTGGGGVTTVEEQSFVADLHIGDPNPALVTAGGSIQESYFSIPKAATIVAGQDMTDLSYIGQNLSPTDQTVIMAGQDITYSDSYAGYAAANGISVGGPGALDILAGRNIALGFSGGVVTTGNLLNANLPTAQGADLTMVTGLGREGTAADFAGFLAKIADPSAAYQAELVSYVESVTGSSFLSFASAQSAFEALSANEQRPFIDQVFFDELGNSGIADNTVPGAGFAEGYAAISALFPGSIDPASGTTPYSGNLTLDFSRIYTLSGGNLTLIVPGGSIDVGLANPPPNLSSRSPSTLGIVTEEAGNINIYSLGDVNVNASRIFTLGGGNILIWSNTGSIDAGLGAKTSVSAPPPTVLIASNGTITLDFSGAATGSGIRTIQTEPTTPPGNVELVAPVGTVNAGDAGIGSAGNIDIAARSVVGVNNISFGGTATGVPAQVSSIGASLSGATSAGSATSNAASSSVESNAENNATAASLAQTALSWLDVFVTGLGEENCKQDDIECLKRQKTAAH
jgi:filamentous hemagglutinin